MDNDNVLSTSVGRRAGLAKTEKTESDRCKAKQAKSKKTIWHSFFYFVPCNDILSSLSAGNGSKRRKV